MNRDQIFLSVIDNCQNKELTLPFLTAEIAKDKTRTLRKYMRDFGFMQLGLYLQEMAKKLQPPKKLIVNMGGTTKQPGEYIFNPPPSYQKKKTWSTATANAMIDPETGAVISAQAYAKKYNSGLANDAFWPSTNGITFTGGHTNQPVVDNGLTVQPFNPESEMAEYEEDDDE